MRTSYAVTGPTWLVVLLPSHGDRAVVADPHGVTPATAVPHGALCAAGVDRLTGTTVTWAWGRVAAAAPVPRVCFRSRLGLRSRPGAVRRISATLWAAQAPGTWQRVAVE